MNQQNLNQFIAAARQYLFDLQPANAALFKQTTQQAN
jgi:hypothetical protein